MRPAAGSGPGSNDEWFQSGPYRDFGAVRTGLAARSGDSERAGWGDLAGDDDERGTDAALIVRDGVRGLTSASDPSCPACASARMFRLARCSTTSRYALAGRAWPHSLETCASAARQAA